jgi:hypothetical protein
MLSILPAALFLWLILSITIFWSVLASSSVAAGGLALLSSVSVTLIPSLFSSTKRYGPYYLEETGKAIAAGTMPFREAVPALLVTAFLVAVVLAAAFYLFGTRDI